MARMPGPNGPVAYERDELGYPSIQARDLFEGTFALGYLHAYDRLAQVVLTTLAARGELMSAVGDVPLARFLDRSMRILAPASDLERKSKLVDDETRKYVDAYCAGFNAGARKRGRPLLLRLLGVRVPTYTPALIAAVFRFISYFGLTSMQVGSELAIAELAARGAPRRLIERLLGPGAKGFDPDDARNLVIPEELLRSPSSLKASPMRGSNAFAVAPNRSATGGALLMGEFHMEVGQFPPLLYAAHIDLPNAADDASKSPTGECLTGITIPGVAWFAAGRTRYVGWSYTFAHADNVNVLVERVKDGQYLAAGEYRPFRRRVEHVAIRGKPSEAWELFENDYGTLLGDAKGEGDRACVRLSGFSETHRALAAGRRVVDCRTVEDLIELHREIRNVSLEGVFADSAGSIGGIVTGQIDERPHDWTGAYPRRGWDLAERTPRTVGEELRPVALRPESGVLVSANQGGPGPERTRWCSLPEAVYRFDRITELLAATERHDLESLLGISYDRFDRCASRLLRVWGPLLPDHPLAPALVQWGATQTDQSLVGLFHELHEAAYCALLAEDIGSAAAPSFALSFYQHHVDDVLALERPELLDESALRSLLAAAFPVAVASNEKHSVPVRTRFKHMIARGRTPAFLGFDSPVVELPGSPTTPFQARVSVVAGESHVYAPAFHLVFDMSRPGAWYNLPGGASESRFGPGYGRGVSAWLEGTMLPLGRSDSRARLRRHEG